MTPGPPENDQSCVKSEVATSGKRGGGLLKDMEREGGEELKGGLRGVVGGWGVEGGLISGLSEAELQPVNPSCHFSLSLDTN